MRDTPTPPAVMDTGGLSAESITQSFQNSQNRNQSLEILKELFDKGKIHLITDLTSDEIKLVVRINMIAKMKKLKLWEEAVELFLMLLLSKKRASRKELIKAIISQPQDENSGFFDRFNPLKRRSY